MSESAGTHSAGIGASVGGLMAAALTPPPVPTATPAPAPSARPSRKKKRSPQTPWDVHMSGLRREMNKAQLPLGLLEAYLSRGWRDSAVDKLLPQSEIDDARLKLRRIKASLRERVLALRDCEAHLPQLPPDEGDGGEGEGDDDDDEQQQQQQQGIDVEEVGCATCGGLDCEDDNDILLCDLEGCRRAFHMRCLDPPLRPQDVPEGDCDWFCHRCQTLLDAVEMVNQEFDEDFDGPEEVFAQEWADHQAGAPLGPLQRRVRAGVPILEQVAASPDGPEIPSSDSDFSPGGEGAAASESKGSDGEEEDEEDEEGEDGSSSEEEDDADSVASGDLVVVREEAVVGRLADADVGRAVRVETEDGAEVDGRIAEAGDSWTVELADGSRLPMSAHALQRALEAAERVASRERRAVPDEERVELPDSEPESGGDSPGDSPEDEDAEVRPRQRSRRARPRVDYAEMNRLMFGDAQPDADLEAMDCEYEPGQELTDHDMQLARQLQASLMSVAGPGAAAGATASGEGEGEGEGAENDGAVPE